MSDPAVLRERLVARLRPLGMPGGAASSDYDLNPEWKRPGIAYVKAAVLLPIVTREGGATVLFTERTAEMPTHAGQISFPGGRMHADDASPVETALREAEEEIALARAFVEPVGLLDTYETGSGFSIVPVVALVREGYRLSPDGREVAGVFEAPLGFLMDAKNVRQGAREWRGAVRRFYAIPFEGHNIWGATAGMLVNLQRRAFA